MNIAKNKKVHSIKTKLIIPSVGLFSVFVVVLTSLAYYIFASSTNKNNINQVHSTSTQVLSNYETFFESAIAVSDEVQVKVDNLDIDADKDEVGNYFDVILSLKNEINSMALFDLYGNKIVSNKNYKPYSSVQDTNWLTSAINEPLVNIFSRVESSASSNYYFILSKHVNFNRNTQEGILKVEYDFDKIIKLISQTDLGSDGHISIYDKNDNLVYSSTSVKKIEKETVENLVLGMKEYKDGNNNFIIFLSTIQYTSWRVAIISNNNAIYETLNLFIWLSVLASLVSLVVFIVFFVILSNQLTRPLIRLQNEMFRVENFDYELEKDPDLIKGSKEIQSLNRSFVQMMQRIKDLMNKVLDEQNEQRKSELKALQNQINPHFLYNTLDSIIFLIDTGENQKAEKMIVALSKFFRISISRGRNVIPLLKEIEHAQYYLTIQKMRFGDSFSYQINVDDGMDKYDVTKLILQPIVENAIAHGIVEKKEQNSLIIINCKDGGEFIIFEVIDNGFGILPEKIAEIYSSFADDSIYNGVGLKNVYQRIKLFYGEKADIKIESEIDVGTKISIIIPKTGGLNNEEK